MITYIIIYIVGCILSYGRNNAGMYEIDEACIQSSPPEQSSSVIRHLVLVTLLSWFGFGVGIIMYFQGEKYFLKWSYKDLWDRYYEHNPIKTT